MFCPKCESEYRDGFTECADCRIALVPEVPIEEPDQQEYVDFKELLTTNNQGEIALFKSILEAEEIPFLVQGDHFSRVQAHGIAVRFLVPGDFLEPAKKLFDKFI